MKSDKFDYGEGYTKTTTWCLGIEFFDGKEWFPVHISLKGRIDEFVKKGYLFRKPIILEGPFRLSSDDLIEKVRFLLSQPLPPEDLKALVDDDPSKTFLIQATKIVAILRDTTRTYP